VFAMCVALAVLALGRPRSVPGSATPPFGLADRALPATMPATTTTMAATISARLRPLGLAAGP